MEKTLEKHQLKSTWTRTGILYSNLGGTAPSSNDEGAVDDEDVVEFKNEADDIWEEESNFTSYDNGEINVINDIYPEDYISEEAYLTTKEMVEIVTNIEITEESVESVSDIDIPEEIVRNENKIIEKTVKNLNNIEILDSLPGDDEISSKSINNNISSEPINEISKSKRKLELDKTLPIVTILSKEKQIAEMKKKEENYNYVNSPNSFKEFLNIDTLNHNMEVHSKIAADGPHCERCDLRFASQEAFDNHKTCFTNHADKRTTKINPRLTEPMVVNGIQFAKSPHFVLRKYNAPPGYPPLFGAPLKKLNADSLKVKTSSNTSIEDTVKTVYSDANIPELSEKTKHLDEAKEKANCTETVLGGENKETCKDKFICNECGHKFHKKDSIILHIKTKHVKYIYFRFKKSVYSSVTKDRLEKHSKLNCEKRKYFCDECNNRFISKNVLEQHKQRCGIKNNVSNTHSAAEPYSCTKCGMKFILKHDFIRHMTTHTGGKPYLCTVCNKQFSQSSHLNAHMRTHTGEKPYSCTVCKKQFSDSSSLNRHMRTHTGEKPYSCTVCKKQFSLSGNLNRHMRTHTGEKRYSCTACNKQFSQSGHLNRHIMTTHTGGKPYVCTVCNKQFSLSHHLDSHMTTHTGEKPYSCIVCNKQFSQSGHLNTHMRTHTGEKPYSCSVCKKRFSDNSVWRRHSKKCQ